MYIGLRVGCPLFWSGFNHTCSFSTYLKKEKYQIARKSVQWESRVVPCE